MLERSKLLLAVWTVLLAGIPLFGAGRFHIEDATLPAGATGQEIPLLCDNDFASPDDPVYGFSFGLTYDPAKISVTAVEAEGTLAEGAAFFGGRIVDAAGMVGYGCVFGYETIGDVTLPVGTDLEMATLVIDVVADSNTTAALTWETVQVWPAPAPATKNILSVDGVSVVPTLEGGTITIESVAPVVPVITEIQGGSGFEGTVFQVVGENFDQPGLAVTVCGSAAAATLRADNVTIDVTAPACGTIGLVEVEVCTDHGCDSDPQGFEYREETEVPQFIRGDSDDSGGLDLTDGIKILNYLYLGGLPSVCHDAMDSDDSGSIELTDGVRIFMYLFMGGAAPQAPYPSCGEDATPDGLPCAASSGYCEG
ncbi:MAG: hypothetical protein JXA90_00510 [Planctomycetes bacterium]|nr:hypothetical protein [Planctomycetota bacterium]